MKKFASSKRLPLTAAGLGGAALLLRRMLYAVAVDEKNLLVTNHPLEWALLVLTAAVLVLTVFTARKADVSGETGGTAAVTGHVLAAAGILATMLTTGPAMEGYLGNLWLTLGWASPVCLVLAGLCRLRGKKPFFLLHLVPSLFLVFHIISHYRIWCGDPQLQDYIFSLFGAIALMLYWFHTAALEAGAGKPRVWLGMGLAAVYLCMAELAMSQYPLLYAGGVAFALTNLTSAVPDSKPAEDEA